MPTKPAAKCLKCAMYFDSANFCAHLTSGELCDLSAESRTATLKRGQTLDVEVLQTWPIVAVASGILSIQHLLEDGRKSIAAFFMRGDIIDLRNISNRNRGHLVALGKSEICRLSPEVFETVVAHNPNVQKLIWENLREQAFRAVDHSADLAKKQALEKLASFIFECRHRQTVHLSDSSVSIPVRRCDLAEYLGMQPETVSRCFKYLEEHGIVELNNLSSVTILNIPVLRRIANGDKLAGVDGNPANPNIKILSFG